MKLIETKQKSHSMKKLMKNFSYRFAMLTFLLLSGIYTYAQDTSGSSQTVTTHSSSSTGPADTVTVWYAAPWVWVVGIIVLLLILVAIFSGKKNSKNEVIRTTKVTTEVKND